MKTLKLKQAPYIVVPDHNTKVQHLPNSLQSSLPPEEFNIPRRLSKKSKFAFLLILSAVNSTSCKPQNEGFRVFRQSQV